MPKTPCRAIGCPALVNRADKGFCDKHANHRYGWHKRQQGKTTTERGYGQTWRKLRQQVMERDGYLYQVCKRQGKLTEAQAVDHVINKAQGGTDELTNLQAICHQCHKIKTQSESHIGGGWLKSSQPLAL